MADVNLTIQATSTGVNAAVTKLGELQIAGKRTGSSLNQLGKANQRAFTEIAAAAKSGLNSAKNSLMQNDEALIRAKVGVTQLGESYKRMAAMMIGATAAQRIKALGDGNMRTGMARALEHENQQEAIGATIGRDRLTVDRQRLEMVNARATLTGAQANLAAAQWERELAAMTPLARATAIYRKAIQELSVAKRMMNSADVAFAGNKSVANMHRQAAAANRAAAALRSFQQAKIGASTAGVAVAGVGVAGGGGVTGTGGGATESRGNQNAFMSSFSYFIIAGLADKASGAIGGMGVAAIEASTDIERAFVDIERTTEGTQGQLESLRGTLKGLATSTPISIIDLAEIAALGNQLGVAAADVEEFTRTIAKYSAVSGQSAEASATAFGRISNLTGLAASKYENLGSAIEYVARTTVATESTIMSTAKEITALSSGAGFSAQAIVGLAGALSSLAIPPARARGALSLYFGALNEAVSQGGPKMEAFATLTNKTATELESLVRESKGQEIFTAFVAGLSNLNTVAKSTALDDLGLSTIRVNQTMRALSQNVSLVKKSFEGSNQAFVENVELSNQYGIIQDTLASHTMRFQNAVQLVAGTFGDEFEPALKGLLEMMTEILVNFQQFADNPIGGFLIKIVGLVGVLVFAITGLIGALALAKASLVIIPWALTGLGVNTVNNAVIRFIAGLFGMNLTLKAATGTMTKATVAAQFMSKSFRKTEVASVAAARGMRSMRWALGGVVAVALAFAVGAFVTATQNAGKAARLTKDDVSGLSDAIKADTATWKEGGDAITTFKLKTSEASEDQKEAASSARALAKVLGGELTDGANAAGDAIQRIAAGEEVRNSLKEALGGNEVVKEIIGDPEFAAQWGAYGLNMNEAIEEGLRSGGDTSKVKEYLLNQIGEIESVVTGGGANIHFEYFNEAGENITDFREDIVNMSPALASMFDLMETDASTDFVLNTGAAAAAATAASSAFRGSSASLDDFRAATQKGMKDFLGFGDIIKEMQGSGDDKIDLLDLDATKFGTKLGEANDKALNFYNGITKLAKNGGTTFATSLASLGPEAQGILTSALDLPPEGQAKLEANARFAGFLASDAFKTAFSDEMENSNKAYALIFKETGDMDQVKAFIAAQIAGTGDEWERQWAVDHPDAPINISLLNPDASELKLIGDILSGRITVTPTVTFGDRPTGLGDGTPVKQYTDTLTGESIVLDATLSNRALSASMAEWMKDQKLSPEKLATILNTENFNTDIEAWRVHNGPITIYATVVPTLGPILGMGLTYPAPGEAKGGEIPHYAGGGQYGQFRGPGTGTSDSIWARVSAGEYINTAASTDFWGPDFFDSLNKKMLPTSFLNLLGAAATSGGGPQSTTNINVVQNNPLTRDPLKQLRESSELVAAGIWS